MSPQLTVPVRRIVMGAAVLAAAAPLAAQSLGRRASTLRAAPVAGDTQRVVFVCEHGTVKSVVAAAHFNRLARERGLPAVAISRGTAPDSVLPVVVLDGLVADGTGPWRARPARLLDGDVPGATLVVSFDQAVEGLVAGRAPVRRWDGTPSVMANYATGRDAIVARVKVLVTELQRTRARELGLPEKQ